MAAPFLDSGHLVVSHRMTHPAVLEAVFRDTVIDWQPSIENRIAHDFHFI